MPRMAGCTFRLHWYGFGLLMAKSRLCGIWLADLLHCLVWRSSCLHLSMAKKYAKPLFSISGIALLEMRKSHHYLGDNMDVDCKIVASKDSL